MLTILAVSLCVSAIMAAISSGSVSDERTNWPVMILAHLFWPVTLACVALEARRQTRHLVQR